MKTLMKSCFVLLGATAASAHHHGHHGKNSGTQTSTDAPSSTTPAATTLPVTTLPAPTTAPIDPTVPTPVALPASPVMKQMIEKAEQQQAEEVADVFYRMFYGGHIQGYSASSFKATESTVIPVKYNSNDYDKTTCVNCNEEKRYRDFDYQYKPNGGDPQTCYAIQRSDEGHSKCEFEDISTTGTDITSSVVDGAVTISLSTSFSFYDRYLINPTAQVFVNGFVSFSVIDPTTLAGNTLPNPSEGPFDLIAPYYQSQTLDGEAIISPAIYYQSDFDETIIQWETNEGVSGAYSQSSQGASVYQVKISNSGNIAFSYKLASCEIPEFTTVQVGVKPLETELQEGYRTSFFQSACQDGGYFAPCPGMSVVLNRVKCASLIGQTGIKKPKAYQKKQYNRQNQGKSSYKKEQYESEKEYQTKKQRYVNYYHDTASKLFSYY